MKRIPSWLTYTVLRLLVFAIPLAILLLLGIVWWISVIAAALIGLCLSYIFLSRPRNAVSSELYDVRHRDKPAVSADDEAEDAAVEGTLDTPTTSTAAAATTDGTASATTDGTAAATTDGTAAATTDGTTAATADGTTATAADTATKPPAA